MGSNSYDLIPWREGFRRAKRADGRMSLEEWDAMILLDRLHEAYRVECEWLDGQRKVQG